ncbi:MAG: hypothetical protein JSV41_02685, partial [Gemmatimonadota bacterium]
DSGVLLTLRYLTPVRRRRSSVDHISGQILDSFAEEPNVEFAYPTYRVYRLREEAAAAELGLPTHADHRRGGEGSK